MEIYEKIRAIRLQKSLTQQSLADLLNCDVATISKIESGQRPLKYHEVEEIAKFYKISLVNLVGYPKRYVEETDSSSTQAVLQIRLSKAKRDEVLKHVFGDIDILDSL